MNGYKKRNGLRIPVSSPQYPPQLPQRLALPPDHPCYNCPIINLAGSKPYCFLPGCLRQTLSKNGGKI